MSLRAQKFRSFTPEEHATWRALFERQAVLRDVQMVSTFSEGLQKLGITGERIPDIDAVNRKLRELTGFEGVPVEGLEEGFSFYPALHEGKFPIGNFIRAASDINYTPAPDVFHDLYGHLPLLADPDYARFTRAIGERASKVMDDPAKRRQYERLYWFGVEFSLLETPRGRRIFGAGIASSFGECAYALSEKPQVIPFDIEAIRHQEFRIDTFQDKIFLLSRVEDLYGCLDRYEAGLDSTHASAETCANRCPGCACKSAS